MRKFFLFLFSLLIGTGLFWWIVKTIGWKQILGVFLVFTGRHGLVILGLTILIMVFGIWKWKVILKSQGEDSSIKNLSQAYLGGYALTYLAPVTFFAGEAFRSYFIKQKKNSLSWGKAISSICLDKILDFTFMLLSAMAGLLFFLFKIGLPPKNLGIILGGILILFTFSISFFYFKIFKKESIIRFFLKLLGLRGSKEGEVALETEKEIFRFFHKRKYFSEAISLALLRNLIWWARHWFLIYFLGGEIGFLGALSVLGFTYLVSLIPIPALLGSHEATQTFVFSALGLGAGMGTAFTMILRGADLLIAFLGLIILFRFGFKFAQVKLNTINNQQ